MIQPTGKGKSLCYIYQLVALQTKQLVLVFTPTIALMQDQVKQLQSKDIPAIVLGDNGESIEALLMYNNQPLIAYLTQEFEWHLLDRLQARRLHILKQLAHKEVFGHLLEKKDILQIMLFINSK